MIVINARKIYPIFRDTYFHIIHHHVYIDYLVNQTWGWYLAQWLSLHLSCPHMDQGTGIEVLTELSVPVSC